MKIHKITLEPLLAREGYKRFSQRVTVYSDTGETAVIIQADNADEFWRTFKAMFSRPIQRFVAWRKISFEKLGVTVFS